MTEHALEIAMVQASSALDPETNRAALDRLVPEGPDGPDLVVFPEAFARDFGDPSTDLGPYAEPADGPFGTELARVAAERGATLVAGMFEQSDDPSRPYNTLLVRGAVEAAYRKIHLYDSFGYKESDRLSSGPVAPSVIEVGGWKVGLMTCYDLRFPELSRALVDAGAELLLVPAAWVAGAHKVEHWTTLLAARAIENTVFVAGVGQTAPRYCGHSMLVDPYGDVVTEVGPGDPDDPIVVTTRAEREVLEEARRTNPSLENRRL